MPNNETHNSERIIRLFIFIVIIYIDLYIYAKVYKLLSNYSKTSNKKAKHQDYVKNDALFNAMPDMCRTIFIIVGSMKRTSAQSKGSFAKKF